MVYRVNNQTLDHAILVFDTNPQQMKGKSRFLLTLRVAGQLARTEKGENVSGCTVDNENLVA